MEITRGYEVIRETVEDGSIPPDWRDDFDARDREAFPFKDHRFAVRRIYQREGEYYGETLGLYGYRAEAVAECDRLNRLNQKEG